MFVVRLEPVYKMVYPTVPLFNRSNCVQCDNASTTITGRVADIIDLYVPLILCVSGTACNMLVVMVMYTKHFRHISTSFYIMVNAIVDTSSLALVLPVHWLYVNFPEVFVKTGHSHIMCKFFNFFGWASSDLGILLTAAMTTDRAIAVSFPLQATSLCTTTRAKFGVAVVTVVVTLKDLHFLLTSVTVSRRNAEYLCEVDGSEPLYAFFWTSLWPWFHNVFLLAAFVVIAVSNVIIIRHVRRSNTNLTSHARDAVGGCATRRQSRGRQLSLMLLVDSFSVVVFTLPYSVIVTLRSWDRGPADTDVDRLVYAAAFYLLYVNRCANFYLYCLSGARFRHVVRQVVCRTRPVSGARKSTCFYTCQSHVASLSPSDLPTSVSSLSTVCLHPERPR